MKAEQMIKVVEEIKSDALYKSGKIDFVADIIDLNNGNVSSYNVNVKMFSDRTAFHFVRFAAKFDGTATEPNEFNTLAYFRINENKEIVLQIM